MNQTLIERLRGELQGLREQGLYKGERVLEGPQGGVVHAGGRDVINLCANNYLGLANHPAVRAAAQRGARSSTATAWPRCASSAARRRSHKTLEERLARFLGTEDAILYSSCFDANGGLFETLLDERDAVISDALNHASIIDGIRLCKAQRLRYANSDMAELEQCLKEASGARTRLIATDGVFSMDGFIAKLGAICDLAERYDALVMVDDSHATGFMGAHGRGTPEHCGVAERVDILTGTLGKALGGGSGGYVAARRESHRVAAAALAALPVLQQHPAGRGRREPCACSTCSSTPRSCARSCSTTRASSAAGSRRRASRSSRASTRSSRSCWAMPRSPGAWPMRCWQRGVYVIGFSFPVVPKGQARIRTQMSAALNRDATRRAPWTRSRASAASSA